MDNTQIIERRESKRLLVAALSKHLETFQPCMLGNCSWDAHKKCNDT